MILPDDTPPSPTKSRAGPLSQAVDEEYIPPPPAYPGHTTSESADIEAQAGTSTTPLIPPEHVRSGHHVEQVEHAPMRFLKAFAIAILIYVVAGSFARSAYSIAHHRSVPHSPSRGHGRAPWNDTPEDGHTNRCAKASKDFNAQSVVTVSFELPLSADTLYILGQGALARGSITFAPQESHSVPRDAVSVHISSRGSGSALDLLTICQSERAHGERGIEISSLGNIYEQSSSDIVIDVRFPVPHNGGVLGVKAFETDLPQFEHVFTGLEGKVHFQNLSLMSRDAPIRGDYIGADQATFITSSAKISGNFHVSRSLFLKTSHANVDADVALHHDDRRGQYTNLTIENTLSSIDARVTLHSTAPDSLGGLYNISAHTRNSPLTLSVGAQPAASTLRLDARTTNARATVRLPPAFEGAFHAATTADRVVVECDARAPDPLGLGRPRVCTFDDLARQWAHGWTAWGANGSAREARHGRGDVRVASSNAQVQLTMPSW